MNTNSMCYKFLEAINLWNSRRRNLRAIPTIDVYLNLIYSLGGKLPRCQEDKYIDNTIPLEQRKYVLESQLIVQLEYLVDELCVDENLVLQLLTLSMNQFLDTMLERLLIHRISSRNFIYIHHDNLISEQEQLKLLESKQLWKQIIDKKLPLQTASLKVFSSPEIYAYDSIHTTYKYLESITLLKPD